MGEAEVNLVRRAVEALGAGDLDGAIACGHPDAHISTPMSDYRGHEGFRDWWADLNSQFDEFSVEATEYVDCGGSVVAAVTMSGRGSGSGAEVDAHIFVRYTVADGLVTRVESFLDRDEALAAG